MVAIAGETELVEVHRGTRHLVLRRTAPGEAGEIWKTVVREHPSAPALGAALRREYQLLRELAAPGAAHALGLRELDSGPALVMADAGPTNLEAWLRRRPVTPALFLTLAIDLAQVLVRLHEQSVLHRDVCPANVVVGADGRLTLVDFGAATRLSAGGVPGRLAGALPYIAPEETGRTSRLVDHRADLYSLGATFYQMLTGSPPFSVADPVELVHAQLARAPVPPDRLNAVVPALLSDITVKLLEKMPERRYQSAVALLADLREAARRLDGNVIASFELGLVDLARELPLPDRLYGRQRELESLRAAWQRAAAGGKELVLLAGPAGVGKSALVEELRRPVAERGGHLLVGKLDAHGRQAPYAPLADAFAGLVTTILSQSQEHQAHWRRHLQEALGRNGALMIELLPPLARLLGAQPPVAPLGPRETAGRFRLTFEAFVRALATPEQPLVLCLDDLQWADPGSLELFGNLAAADVPHFLLIGIHRADVDRAWLDGLLAPPASKVESLALAPLGPDELTALCCDALRCAPARGRPLAELIARKTAGNPLFVRRLLRFLHQSGVLTFDGALGTWTWDLPRVEAVRVSDNVVDLLLASLRRLPPNTQEVLQCAACLGNVVSLELLASAWGSDREATAAAVWAAVAEGLLLAPGRVTTDAEPTFIFAHDRIQQAAYELLDPAERPAAHLRLGRRLLAASDERALDQRLYLIAGQLDQGKALISDPGERLALAELELRAARKARQASAFAAARTYAERAIALLPAGAWETQRALAFALYRLALESAHVAGDLSGAGELFAAALAGVRTDHDRAELYAIEVQAATGRMDIETAIRRGRDGLAMLGIEVPAGDAREATARELAAVTLNLRGRAPAQLLSASAMEDPVERARMRMLAQLSVPMFQGRPELFPWLIGRLVNLSLVHGHTQSTPFAYVSYGFVLGMSTGDLRAGHAFGQLGAELARRSGDAGEVCRTITPFAAFINLWCAPLRTSVAMVNEVGPPGIEAGEILSGVTCATLTLAFRHHQGVELSQLFAESEAALGLARRTNLPGARDAVLAYRQAIRCLQGLTRARDSFDDAGFDEAAYLADTGSVMRQVLYLVRRLEVAYLLGDLERARALSTAGMAGRGRGRSFVLEVEHAYYTALTLAASCARATDEQRPGWLAALAAEERALGRWAGYCPENYRHKHLLVAAERARLEGRLDEAGALYDQAIEAAQREGFVQDEALGNELCGRYYRGRDRRRLATIYLTAARDGFQRWGAAAKVDALHEEFPELVRAASPRADAEAAASLDLLALLRASEAIASEVVLDRLLGKLIEVCLATAGAQRGVLLLAEDGHLYVRAEGSMQGPASLQRTRLDESPVALPRALIERVHESDAAVVIGDAARPESLEDGYLAHGVRSVLAMPIRRQGQRVGVLYLENNLATRVFTPDRVQFLELLSSQIATSLQISLLFEGLTHEVDERKRAEAAEHFLANAGAALVGSLDDQATLEVAARLAVGYLADWCLVDLFEEGMVRRVTAAHVDPVKEKLLHELRARQERLGAPPQALEMRFGAEPVVLATVTEEVLRRYVSDPEAQRLAREVGLGPMMILPLRARERLLGAMTLVLSTRERPYDARELALGQELARRVAVAIDNARLFQETKQAVRLRDDFLSIASHELNTPIAALQLSVDGLAQVSGSAPPEFVDGILKLATRQTRRLAKLVRELMSVAELQAGRLRIERATVDLSAVVRDVAAELRPDLDRAGCTLALDAPAPVEGPWDRARLDQVLQSLLSNAMKFGPGKVISVVVAESPPGTARLVIEDHGIGIPPQRLRHIFGRFERAVSAENFGGLGLGLYVVREIVGALGGTVSVESTPGVGSKFTVELPRAPAAP